MPSGGSTEAGSTTALHRLATRRLALGEGCTKQGQTCACHVLLLLLRCCCPRLLGALLAGERAGPVKWFPELKRVLVSLLARAANKDSRLLGLPNKLVRPVRPGN